MKKAIILFSLISGLLMMSCASRQRASALESTVKGYARALRDADEAILLGFVHPDQQKAFALNSSTLGVYQFSNVEVRKIFPDERLKTALVSLDLEFFDQSGAELIHATRQYAWSYDEKKKAWFLKESTPFGSR